MKKDRSRLLEEISQALNGCHPGTGPKALYLNSTSNEFKIDWNNHSENVTPEKLKEVYENYPGTWLIATIRESEKDRFSYLMKEKAGDKVSGFIYIVPEGVPNEVVNVF